MTLNHGIISVVCADNLLAAHLEPDDVQVLSELESWGDNPL